MKKWHGTFFAAQLNDDNNNGVIDNNDLLDLATANFDANSDLVLLGTADGSFSAAAASTIGRGAFEDPVRADRAVRAASHSRVSDQDDIDQAGADQDGASVRPAGHWAALDLLFASYDERSVARDFDSAARRRKGQVMDLDEFLDRVLGTQS